MAITASQARAQLFPLIEQVNEDMKPVVITSKAGNAVLISQSEYESMIETAYLLSTPANREWLLESLAQADRGELIPLTLPLQAAQKPAKAPKKGKWTPVAKAKLSKVLMTQRASKDIEYWLKIGNEKKIARINALIESCLVDPLSGIGVPEQLRFRDEATFSRRIDKTHRLVYRVDGKDLIIISARFHYEK